MQLKRGNSDGSAERSGNRRHAGDAKRAEILQLLLDAGEPLATADLAKRVNASVSLLRPLERHGFLHITQAETVRNPLSTEPVAPTQPLSLNSAQLTAFSEIQNALASHTVGDVFKPDSFNRPQHPPTFLLHGVTGSGKTEVYMQAMAEVLENGKSVIVLVPRDFAYPANGCSVCRSLRRTGRVAS